MTSRLIFASAILALTIGCSQEKGFKGGVNSANVENAGDARPVDQVSSKLVEKTSEFELAKERVPIDMVWVIDNSGSMSNEIAQVRSNFKKFMTSVSSRSDLQLTLISQKTDSFTAAKNTYGMQLDANYLDQGHVQIDQEVSSYDLLALAAVGLCPASETVFESMPTGSNRNLPFLGTMCGVPSQLASNEKTSVTQMAGKLASRMRAKSQKVFVFVTDDDALYSITETNFLSATKLASASTHAYVFGAVAKKAGCGITNVSKAYQALAKATGGDSFDICDTDWSANFAKLTESVIKLATSNFSVGNAGSNIKKVLLDGVELDASAYKVEKNQVTLVESEKTAAGVTLTIVYDIIE